MAKPSHVAYVVSDPKEGSDKKAYWREVGAVFAHKKGEGFDLVIPEGIALSGRVICMPWSEKEKAEK